VRHVNELGLASLDPAGVGVEEGGDARSTEAAAVAAVSAASQSAQSLTGYSPGSFSPRAGFSELKEARDCALRHSPAMRTGWLAIAGS
jgi:hypothetical protein